MQNQRRKKESDLLKKTKTNKLPQKQPAKEKSPDTQRTDYGLRAEKTDGYAEGRVGQTPASCGQTPV